MKLAGLDTKVVMITIATTLIAGLVIAYAQRHSMALRAWLSTAPPQS